MHILAKYLHAKTTLRSTSRASNPQWYAQALAQPEQLHYFVDTDERLQLFHYSASLNEWRSIAQLTIADLLKPDSFSHHLEELETKLDLHTSEGLGVTVHLAQELNLREGRRIYNHHSWQELNHLLETEVSQILDDPEADSSAFRRRAYPLTTTSKNRSTYIVNQLKSDFEPLLKQWRRLGNKRNKPITTQVLSTPFLLDAYLSQQTAQPSSETETNYSQVRVIHFKNFTLLSFIDADGQATFYRSLPHHGNAYPNQLAITIQNTATSIELQNYQVHIISNLEDEAPLLRLYKLLSQALENEVHMISRKDSSTPRAESLAIQKLDFDPLKDTPLLQNYETITEEEATAYPTLAELKLTQYLRWGQYALTALFLIYACFSFLNVYKKTLTPEWAFTTQEKQTLTATLFKLNKRKAQLQQWNMLLKNRSRGWQVMHIAQEGFTFTKGVQLSTVEYQTAPLFAEKSKTVGLQRNWNIRGKATPDGRIYLDQLNTTEGVTKLFDQLAQLPKAESFQTDVDSRNLVINTQVELNSRPGKNPFVYDFSAQITQRLETTDTLALTATP